MQEAIDLMRRHAFAIDSTLELVANAVIDHKARCGPRPVSKLSLYPGMGGEVAAGCLAVLKVTEQS
jgi:hypothetical protein